jgi:hypothetical protein
MCGERRRFRAAGQAIAALWHDIPVTEVGIAGVEIDWPKPRSRYCSRADVLIDVAIGLAGIAAVCAYRFGRLDSYEDVCTWGFGAGELEDFAEVRALIEEIDPEDTHDLLRSSWSEALAFLNRPAVWQAIEIVASALRAGTLTQREVEDRSARAVWGELLATVGR